MVMCFSQICKLINEKSKARNKIIKFCLQKEINCREKRKDDELGENRPIEILCHE